jgi:hypothetical protein
MIDRAELPTPARVHNRLMFALPMTTLVCFLMGGGATPVLAQATPAAPAPAVPNPVPPAPVTPDPAAPTAVVPATADATPATPAAVPQNTTSLLVIVRSTDDGQPVPLAAVRVDSETERARSKSTNNTGNALFNDISDGTYNIVVTALQRATGRLTNVVVPAGTSTVVTIFLSPQCSELIRVTRTVDLLDHTDYSISYTRDQRFLKEFPFNAGNHQDLNHLLLSVPGVAYDAPNRVVPRGEDMVATSTTMDGTLMPQHAQGQYTALYLPDSLTSFRAIVGNFAPEYTGSGMALNLTTRPVPAQHRELDYTGAFGEYNTFEDDVNFGTRGYPGGFRRRAAAAGTRTFKDAPFGYVFSLSQRVTDNTAESPQAGNQTTTNFGGGVRKVRFPPEKQYEYAGGHQLQFWENEHRRPNRPSELLRPGRTGIRVRRGV